MFARMNRSLALAAIPLGLAMAAPTASAATHRPAVVTRDNLHTTGSRMNDSASYTNWVGYQMRTSAPSAARATWTVPAVAWQGRDGYSNQWVGIGGGTSTQGQLIQAGTESDNVCVAAVKGRCTRSQSTYFMWLETYPQRSQERITNMPLSPGDKVDVHVSYEAASATATFTLCNVTRNSCVSATRATSAPRGVAEFVMERPSDAAGHQLALADYRRSGFSGMQMTNAGTTVAAGALPTIRITMFNGHTLATSDGLAANGSSFTTTFQRAI